MSNDWVLAYYFERLKERESEYIIERREAVKKNMKSFCDNDDNNHSNTTNLLGFSLSSNMMKMGGRGGGEAIYSSTTSSAATSSSSVPPQLVVGDSTSNFGVCYGSNSAGEIYSHMSVMPLRSDGSLCLMEALNRSSHSNHHQG